MRTHLLTTTAVMALLAAMPAQAQDATWQLTPVSGDFNTAANWNPAAVPTGTAFFGASANKNLTFNLGAANSVGQFLFNFSPAGAYSFTLAPLSSLTFTGAGIQNFAGIGVQINNNGNLTFAGASSAGDATITNNFQLLFTNTSTAGNATITTNGITTFAGNSTGGNAQLITNAGANLTFEFTAGPNGDNQITAGSIAGAGNYILPGKTLTVGSNNLSTDVSGQIIGAGGSLVKTGSGTLTLSGINTYTGTTTVNAGALIVDGSIASSSLTTVNSRAALLGVGTMGSTIINSGGFLAPGAVGTIGTITVNGNLTFQPGSFYVVQVNPATASNTNVSGTASLAGTVAAVFAPGAYVTRSYPILTANGGLMGTTFDGLVTRGLPSGFGVSVNNVANTAFLNLRAQLVPEPPGPGGPTVPSPTIPQVPGLPPSAQPSPPDPPAGASAGPPLSNFTVNQLNVGRTIDNFFNNGGALPPAFVSLFNLTGNNLTNALDQLSGEAATGAQKVGFQLFDQFVNLMLDPFVDGRCGFGRPDQPPRTDQSLLGFGRQCPPVYEPGWTVWGAAYGGSNHTGGNNTGSHDLYAGTFGGAAGLDYHFTPDTVVGFALGGGGTNWNLSQGLGGGTSSAFQAGLYGSTRYGPAYLSAAFAFANNWMSTDRFAVGDRLTAKFSAQSYGGRLEGGYSFGTLYGGFTPYAAIEGQNFHTLGYSETAPIQNDFALAFGARDASDIRVEAGARYDGVLAVYSNAVLALRGRVAWAHDWVSDPTLTALFQALPGASFVVSGATPPQNSLLTSLGAELRLASGLSLLAKFDGAFASNSSTLGGTATLRYRW
jgi:autotransporter-associated beta strand protein